MSFILYTLGYFIVGFILAKFYKAYHTFNKVEHVDYAWAAILWLPIIGFALIGKIYDFYKEKL